MIRADKPSTASSQKSAKRRRLFFALWPDERVRRNIATFNQQLPAPERGGRLMAAPNLHLTLHYIGPVDEVQMACLKAAAQAVEGSPFRLVLDRLGWFKRPRVLWLGCEEMPAGYLDLLQQLADRIGACGFRMAQGENRPHVTLRRKVSRPATSTQMTPVEWLVEQFVLVESLSVEGGVSYQVIERYTLNSPL